MTNEITDFINQRKTLNPIGSSVPGVAPNAAQNLSGIGFFFVHITEESRSIALLGHLNDADNVMGALKSSGGKSDAAVEVFLTAQVARKGGAAIDRDTLAQKHNARKRQQSNRCGKSNSVSRQDRLQYPVQGALACTGLERKLSR